MPGWTRENLRHLGTMLRLGRNPAAAVYESLGSDLFLTPAPGWLNVGWWRTGGDPDEAAGAPRALVERLAAELPAGGTVVDVANGLGAQDPVIAAVARPARLVAVNITAFQLRAGAARLAEARARPVCGDATHLPLAGGCAEGVISVEAAFHFPSRAAFFREARRVLRQGGVLSMSDVGVERMPRTAKEFLAGALNVRFWGLRRSQAESVEQIEAAARAAGFTALRIERCGDRTIDPMIRWCRARLATRPDAPALQRWGAARMLDSWAHLRRRGMIEYILLRATAA